MSFVTPLVTVSRPTYLQLLRVQQANFETKSGELELPVLCLPVSPTPQSMHHPSSYPKRFQALRTAELSYKSTILQTT